ncbi:phosphoenolpyruvate--protein phosphotransferase [Desulfovermiculus halophilus]|jgi:phosphotransferase system enzyme I (PtsI)|uniref:phosphoenolpyruvate--protein phosphotransferase n=1 Tax=Desulfovermiculus halophilus TaxID=339722 RepID=UPI0004891A94|nr:phosphoenolpyruvate--protein phosphotransferase [Desulfovermiculus halophilus]
MAAKILHGIPVSAGISIGRAYLLSQGHYCLAPMQSISQDLVEVETARLNQAFAQALESLQQIRKQIPREQSDHAAILDTHIMVLKDPKLRQATEHYIRDMHLNAEWALEKGVADIESSFQGIEDEYFRARVQELRLLTRRVMNQLLGNNDSIKSITSRVILIAHDLSPADTVELDVSKIMAFATAQGGRTSHVAILARTLEIPAVVGVEDLESSVSDNQFIVVDGFRGQIVIDPDETELTQYTDLKYSFEAYQKEVIRKRDLPAETRDGHRVQLHANIELFEEVSKVLDYSGDGVGLYRTEYSYLYRVELPTEQELIEEYRDLASILHPRRLVIRTLDAGGDKLGHGFEHLEEANPVLGLRAVRFCLRHQDIFKTQLRAILRASQAGNISLMFPMISGLGELREVLSVLDQTKEELAAEGLAFDAEIPVGIMIELPSAVMIADILARYVDFFSIGTNDLIQYSLGIDRTNKYVSHLYQPLHPALLRSIKRVVDAGHKAGIEVSMCGEMASDPYCLPILIGMHVDSLSLNPQSIPWIKRILRKLTMEECADLLTRILRLDSVSESNKLVRETIFKRFPDELQFHSSILEEEEE